MGEDQEILPDHHHQNLLSRQECAPPKYHKLGLQVSESVTFGFASSREKGSIPQIEMGKTFPASAKNCKVGKSSVSIDWIDKDRMSQTSGIPAN